MRQWQSSGHELEEGSSQLQIMSHRQLGHDQSANFGACVTLVFLKLNFVGAIRPAAVNRPFEQRKQCRKVRLLTALVEIFEEHEDVLVRQQVLLVALDREVEKA